MTEEEYRENSTRESKRNTVLHLLYMAIIALLLVGFVGGAFLGVKILSMRASAAREAELEALQKARMAAEEAEQERLKVEQIRAKAEEGQKH